MAGLTEVEKQALHTSLYHAGYKPVPHAQAKYVLFQEMANVDDQYQRRKPTENRPVKPGQQMMPLEKFFEKYFLNPDVNEQLYVTGLGDGFDISSLKYSYHQIARFPATGAWHYLLKKYILRGRTCDHGLQDVFPHKMVHTRRCGVVKYRQGTAKVIYLSYALLATWNRLKTIEMPHMSGIHSVPDGYGGWNCSWFFQEHDFENELQKEVPQLKRHLDCLFDQAFLTRYFTLSLIHI